MSVLVDRGEQSALWEGGHYLPAPDHVTELKQLQQTEPMLTVALVNNMPDAAVEDTEAQFLGLLTEAANGRPLHVRLYSLPKVPRSERTREYLAHNYATLDELLNRFPEWNVDLASARLGPTSTVRGWETLPVTIP